MDWDDADDYASRREPRRGGGGRVRGSDITQALREAQQLQQDGQLDDAIDICEELFDSGVDRADVRYFLGWLYQEADRWQDAAAQFELLLDDPEYALSCFYALGQCERAQGNMRAAAQYFDEAVDRVNLDALTPDETDQLLQLCQEAAEAHRDMNDMEGAETIYQALLGFLRSQGWQDQVGEVERMMRETLGAAAPPPARRRRSSASRSNIPQRSGNTGRSLSNGPRPGVMSGGPMVGMGFDALVGGPGYASNGAPSEQRGDHLAQLISNLSGGTAQMRASLMTLPEPVRAQVAQSVREIENYVAHGLLTAAIEECMLVMEIAPQYLDVHLLLGEIYVRQGKIEQAIAKYTVLVDRYLVGGRVDDAIATYRRILQLEPNNLTYRIKLIELLSRQGRSEEVMTERMAAADAYLRMGYADRAIAEYEQALLAYPSNNQVRLSYATALMKAGRAPQAIAEFQRVLQTEPGNVRALAQMQIAVASGAGASLGISLPGAVGMGSSRVAALELLTRVLRSLRGERFASYHDVVRDYIQALDINPTSADLRYALGEIHLVAGQQQEALTALQQVTALAGMEVLGRFALAQAYLLTADPTSAGAAARELEEAAAWVRRVPPEPAAWAARPRFDGEETLSPEVEVSTLLARAYQLSGQAHKGQMVAQAGAQLAQNNEVYQALAQIAARASNPDAALQEYAQLVASYKANKQLENAVAALREMTRIAPNDPNTRNDLAELQIERGMLDEGLSELRALMDVQARSGQLRDAALACQRMAEVYWGMDSRADAMAALRQGIGFAGDNMQLRQQFVQYCLEMIPQQIPEAVEQQAVIARYYFQTRQTKEAVAALQQLIAMDKTNGEAYDLLGQTYYSVGEYEQAARVYRNLAKVDPNSVVARARLQELQSARAHP
ncbi:MAG TPA: tetratricopeptide repeat protein [Ktedonobacterales bacterium]|jgi:tetratricopeptide (TPR) repeat protein